MAEQSEPDPIAVLFDRHYGALYRYLRRRVGLPLAEDRRVAYLDAEPGTVIGSRTYLASGMVTSTEATPEP